MKKNTQHAIEEAQKRLEKSLPDIEKRLRKASEKGLEEPDHLRSGIKIDELEVKRLTKEQDNEERSE